MMRRALLGMGLIICLAWLLYMVASFNASTTHRRMNEAIYALPLWAKLLLVAGMVIVAVVSSMLGGVPRRAY